MTCGACGGESYGAVFTPDGVLQRCNGCGALTKPEEAVPPQLPLQAIEEPSLPPPPPQPSPAKPVIATGVGNVLANARARVRELNAEIKRLESLRKERDELTRLLAAAKKQPPKRTATVRQLRANGE